MLPRLSSSIPNPFEWSLLAANRADQTARTYTKAVQGLGQHALALGMNSDVRNLRREHIEQYVVHLRQEGY